MTAKRAGKSRTATKRKVATAAPAVAVKRPPAKKKAAKTAVRRRISSALRDVVIAALEDMKAVNVKALDVRGLTDITDTMVVASGTSDRHVKSIGVVFGQRSQLWWDIAVIEAFNLLQKIYEIPKADYQARLKRFNEVLGLDDLLNIPVRKLSLGQRMRCDLAASLLHNPTILFLDEPTIGLDVAVKASIRDFIKEINREHGTTVILTTHDLSDIEELCPRVMLIDSGRVLYDGGLEALRDRLGKRRKIIFEFYRPVREEELVRTTDGVAAAWKVVSPYSCECSFEKGEATAARIIEQVSERLSVRDLTVEEPGIEEVVRKIYAERAAERETE